MRPLSLKRFNGAVAGATDKTATCSATSAEASSFNEAVAGATDETPVAILAQPREIVNSGGYA